MYTFLYPQLSDQQFEDYLIRLPSQLQRKIAMFSHWQDAQASLYGKLLLRSGLVKYYQLKHTVLDHLQYSAYGKPCLPETNLDFNISHAGQYVVCVIAENRAVGVDLEEIKPMKIDFFEDQFSNEELADIRNSEDSTTKFLNYWVKKEAVAKATGGGLQTPLKSIRLCSQEGEIEASFKKWCLYEILLDENHCCWLATDKRLERKTINKEYLSFAEPFKALPR